MTHKPLRHRHFVAMPLTMLLLLGVGGLSTLTKAAIPAESFRHEEEIASQDDVKQFSLPEHALSVFLQPNTRVISSNQKQALRMEAGTALMKATSLSFIGLGFGAEATLLMGSMVAISDQSSVTVIALTAPLIVTVAGEEWILPPRYQLRIDEAGSAQRSKTPHAWFLDQLSQSHSLPVTSLPPVSDAERSLLQTILTEDLPSLPDADRRMLLARLIDESEAGIPLNVVHAVFTIADTFPDLLIQHIVALRLSVLAGSMDKETGDQIALRIATQSFPRSELVFAVPAIALSTLRPLPEGLLDLWAQFTIESAASDASLTASVLHPLLPSLPSSYESAGFPKQAILWREAIRRINAVLLPLLSGAERDLFVSDINAALHGDLPTYPSPIALTHSTSSVPEELSSQSAAEVRNFLLEHNVLFTQQTAVKADETSSDCIRVDGVYLAGERTDESYAFSLCADFQMVRRIVRNGKALPNDVPSSKFFH